MSSSYENNVLSLLSELTSESANSRPPQLGFFNTTFGRVPNKAYGSYFCRGDLKTSVCHDCVSYVTQHLSDQSAKCIETFAIGASEVADRCMVHYANRSTGYKKGNFLTSSTGGGKVSDYHLYNQTLTTTIEGLITEAAQGNWTNPYFETRVAQVAQSNEKIYTLVQCTPDISAIDCGRCLEESYSYLPECCNGNQEGDVIHANCWIMYSNQSFFGSADRVFMPSFLHLCSTVLFSLFFVLMN